MKKIRNKFKISIIIVFIIIGITNRIYADVDFINFESIASEDGLSQNSVSAILQTKDEVMWLGTYDGLNIYDGYTFKVIRNEPFTENTISSNIITALEEDEKGNVWIGTVDGLNKYDRKTGKFQQYYNDPNNINTITDNRIRHLFYNDGKLWIGTNSGLSYYDTERDVFKRMDDEAYGIDKAKIRDIKKINNEEIVVAANEGLFFIKNAKVSGKITPYTETAENRLKNIILSVKYQESTNKLWLGTYEGGLISYALDNAKIEYYIKSLGDSVVHMQALEFDESDNLCIGTNNKGLLVFNTYTGKYKNYFHDASNSRSIADNDVLVLKKDNHDNMWVGTYSGGVSKFSLSRFFEYYNDSELSKYKLNDSKIHSIYKDKEILYIGTYSGGINKINRLTNEVEYIKNPYVTNNIVRNITRDSYGNLWIGYENGLFIYDEISKSFEQKIPEIDYNVQTVKQDGDNLWVGTLNGLFCYNLKSGKSELILNKEDISALYMDNDFLWIGTYLNGLIKYDKKTGKTVYYKYDLTNKKSISSNTLNSIVEESKNNLWIGTSNGLNYFDIKSETFKVYSEVDGLSNNNIYCIIKDLEGYLWISTNNGLSRFDTNNKVFLNFGVKDGLQNKEFNTRVGFIAEDGEMFFGGIKGINAFYPKEIKLKSQESKLKFITFKYSDGIINLMDSELKNIKLKSDANSFELDFAVLDYGDTASHVYKYKLVGFDEKWNYIKGRNFMQYTNIPGGNYRLEMYAANERGVWNRNPTIIDIEIEKPFYLKTEAYVLYLAAIIFLSYMSIKLLSHKKEKIFEETVKHIEQKEKELLQTLLDTIPDSILYHTIEGKYIKSNKSFDDFYGVTKQELEDKYVYKYYPENIIFEMKKEYESDIDITELKRIEGEIQDCDGRIHSVILTRAAVIDKEGTLTGIISIATDITYKKLIEEELLNSKEKLMIVNNALKNSNAALEIVNKKLKEISSLDPLTQIPNRRYFETMLSNEWKRAIRNKSNIAVLIIDIDYFKEFNDNYGHIFGDDCIVSVAQAIQGVLNRPSDMVARYGGDEFIVVLPDTDRDGAEKISKTIYKTIESLDIVHEYSKVSNAVTITMGIYVNKASREHEVLDFIKRADEALYKAKNSGRNRYKFHESNQ